MYSYSGKSTNSYNSVGVVEIPVNYTEQIQQIPFSSNPNARQTVPSWYDASSSSTMKTFSPVNPTIIEAPAVIQATPIPSQAEAEDEVLFEQWNTREAELYSATLASVRSIISDLNGTLKESEVQRSMVRASFLETLGDFAMTEWWVNYAKESVTLWMKLLDHASLKVDLMVNLGSVEEKLSETETERMYRITKGVNWAVYDRYYDINKELLNHFNTAPVEKSTVEQAQTMTEKATEAAEAVKDSITESLVSASETVADVVPLLAHKTADAIAAVKETLAENAPATYGFLSRVSHAITDSTHSMVEIAKGVVMRSSSDEFDELNIR